MHTPWDIECFVQRRCNATRDPQTLSSKDPIICLIICATQRKSTRNTIVTHHRPLNSKMKCSEEHVWYCCLIVPCPSRGISTLNHCVRVHITSQGVCCFRLQTFSRLYLLGNPQPAFFLKVSEGCTGEAPFFRATCATLQLLLLTMCICCCAA